MGFYRTFDAKFKNTFDMIASIWRDLKFKYNSGDITTRLIVINCAVFVCINIIKLVSWSMGSILFDDFVQWLSFAKDGWFNLTHPWVLVTNYFLHLNFMHLLGNMLMLSIAGIAAQDTFGNRKLLPVYVLGGLAGNITYWLLAFLFPSIPLGEYMLGASASIMAVLLTATITQPEYRIGLFIFGAVPLKYLSLALIFLDFISIPDGGNTGGHFAHLGGALIGVLIAQSWNQGIDLTKPVVVLFRYITGLWNQLTKPHATQPKSTGPHKVYQSNTKTQRNPTPSTRNSAKEQAILDAILDKIKQSGYDSLSAEERETLFSASRKSD